jgi:alcohol dehydrogenase class IV
MTCVVPSRYGVFSWYRTLPFDVSDRRFSESFIAAITAMRAEMQMPLQPKDLKTEDIPEIVSEAISEAGGLYPVPRYMSEAEIRGLVEGLRTARDR